MHGASSRFMRPDSFVLTISTSGWISSVRRLALVCACVCASGCTEPRPPVLSGTFLVDGRFTDHVRRVTTTGTPDTYDSTGVDSPVFGKLTFDALVDSAGAAPTKVSLAACDYCLVSSGLLGNFAMHTGDSVRVIIGTNPMLQLLGIFRGDSIAGELISTQSGSGSAGTYTMRNRGTFVARRSEPDKPVYFTLRGLYDSVTTTDGRGNATTTAASDSLRGPLTIDDITTSPIGQLTVEKCGATCFGRSGAFPAAYGGFSGGGTRRGDSVTFGMLWDLMSSIQLRGVYRGDSIVGRMTSYRGMSTSTTYTGSFVARRSP
jgi:hypothetical protein